jgi:hypothetical protein
MRSASMPSAMNRAGSVDRSSASTTGGEGNWQNLIWHVAAANGATFTKVTTYGTRKPHAATARRGSPPL